MQIVQQGERSETYGGRFTGRVELEMLGPSAAADRVGLADAEHELAPGAFVSAPAGESHYHGAVRGSDCVWLAITWGVTDWEDRAPERA